MQRRTLIRIGLAAGALLAVAGGTIALLQPARVGGRLAPQAATMVGVLARSILGELWPADPARAAEAQQALAGRLQDTIAGLPPGLQAEVDELLTIAASAPGRLALFGLGTAWAEATPQQVTEMLQTLRLSSLALRQQAFHALRDLINAAWFADRSTWAAIGYPGPRPMPEAHTARPT